MTLAFAQVMASASIDPATALVIRHAYVREHMDGTTGLHADSSPAEILAYTQSQSSNPRIFPASPPPIWFVFLPDGGDRARFWGAVTNLGETGDNGQRRTFELQESALLPELRNRLVIGWRSPRTWWLHGATAAAYPVLEIADAEPSGFPDSTHSSWTTRSSRPWFEITGMRLGVPPSPR